MYNRFPTVESEVLIAEGGIWGVIEAVAEKEKADLIVVGTSGRRGIGKFILGSVTEEILRRAKCPVLTVGPHSPTEPPREAKLKKIVYATNFGEGSPAAAAYAVALAQEYQARLTLLHVIEHPRTGELVRPHELEAPAIGRLRGLVARDAELWCEPKAIVLQGSPAERIWETAGERECRLDRDGRTGGQRRHPCDALASSRSSPSRFPRNLSGTDGSCVILMSAD